MPLTFTIDALSLDIACPHYIDEGNCLLPRFTNAAEFGKVTLDWPLSRLAQVWNSFAGVAPFGDLKPVKKFENRGAAIRRIWEAVQRLAAGLPALDVAPANGNATKKAPAPKKAPTARPAAKPAKKEQAAGGKKAEVIAMMQRKGGAALPEIMAATGWQKHTIRGFVSVLGSKHGMKLESTKNDAGERVYRIK
jgi:hypothetical protein